MADEERYADPAFYGTARAVVRHQPKGVVGNIVPWNFPFDLSVGPLVEMLAAGNRVVLKPSDYTPACADLLRRLIADTFPEDLVAVSVGGLRLAKEFPTVRWDHLLYTGSPAIGREIAVAAAQNLVPVTLELGGKCPAVPSRWRPLGPGRGRRLDLQGLADEFGIPPLSGCLFGPESDCGVTTGTARRRISSNRHAITHPGSRGGACRGSAQCLCWPWDTHRGLRPKLSQCCWPGQRLRAQHLK